MHMPDITIPREVFHQMMRRVNRESEYVSTVADNEIKELARKLAHQTALKIDGATVTISLGDA